MYKVHQNILFIDAYGDYKSRIYFLQLRSSPVCKPRWPSKPNVLGVLLPAQDPWAGETNPGFKTRPPWGELVQL